MRVVEDQFAADGAYYETAKDGEDLIVRQISGYDGVEPSGNSNAAFALLQLSALLQDEEYERKAEQIFLSFYDDVTQYGLNSSFMMQGLHLYLSGCKHVAVVGVGDDASTRAMLECIRRGFFPNAVFAFALEGDPDKDRVPLLAGKKAVDGRATAYVCQHGSCLPPVTSVDELERLLNDYRETG